MRKGVLILTLILALSVACCEKPVAPGAGGSTPATPGQAPGYQIPDSVPNPAAVYCTKLGYEYRVVTDKGQTGYCIFPDGDKCDAWAFFNGKCGQSYTYCEKNGGRITTTTEGCTFSQECAVCILPDGTKCYEWDHFRGKC